MKERGKLGRIEEYLRIKRKKIDEMIGMEEKLIRNNGGMSGESGEERKIEEIEMERLEEREEIEVEGENEEMIEGIGKMNGIEGKIDVNIEIEIEEECGIGEINGGIGKEIVEVIIKKVDEREDG